MSDQPWETHDHLCSRRHPQVAYPRRVCPECRAVVAARAEGYARGLIEGDHGGRREGYRSGYAAGKDAVMTASYAQAVAEGQRDEREACIAAVTPWLPHSSDCNIRHYEGVCDCECAPIVAAIRTRGETS